MGQFQDLDQVFDDSLRLPIGGKVYTIAPPDAELGLWVQRLMAAAVGIANGSPVPENAPSLTLNDKDERELYPRLLGSAFDQLVQDGVRWSKIQMVAYTTFWWISSGIDAASEFWNSGGVPKAPLSRREAKPSGSTKGTGGGNTTRRQGSSSGTRYHKTSSRR
jgi:hypothetical protein